MLTTNQHPSPDHLSVVVAEAYAPASRLRPVICHVVGMDRLIDDNMP